MASPAENPFTALTIVVAPAILTNASSLLCFGTANRHFLADNIVATSLKTASQVENSTARK